MPKKAKISRKSYVDETGGRFHDKTLTHMRAVIAPSIDLNRKLRANEALRNDDELLAKAEVKRQRKAAKRAKPNTCGGNPN